MTRYVLFRSYGLFGGDGSNTYWIADSYNGERLVDGLNAKNCDQVMALVNRVEELEVACFAAESTLVRVRGHFSSAESEVARLQEALEAFNKAVA